MPEMLRKSGLTQLKKFKDFIKKDGGDISTKLKDKTVKNTLDHHIETSDDQKGSTKVDKQLKNLSKKSIINKSNETYLSDQEIEDNYSNYKITHFQVDRFNDYGGASGWIDIEFEDNEDSEYSESRSDHWFKYDSGPRIAFDHWYPEKMNIELKAYIEKGIKKERLKRDSDKYNL